MFFCISTPLWGTRKNKCLWTSHTSIRTFPPPALWNSVGCLYGVLSTRAQMKALFGFIEGHKHVGINLSYWSFFPSKIRTWETQKLNMNSDIFQLLKTTCKCCIELVMVSFVYGNYTPNYEFFVKTVTVRNRFFFPSDCKLFFVLSFHTCMMTLWVSSSLRVSPLHTLFLFLQGDDGLPVPGCWNKVSERVWCCVFVSGPVC